MVTIEIKSLEQRFTISQGRIVEGDMQYSSIVKLLAKALSSHHDGNDPDYLVAQEIVALHGGRIVKHERIDIL